MINKIRSINNGIFLSLLSTFMFSVMFMLIKLVSASIPSEEIVFFRSLICTILVLLYVWANKYTLEVKNKGVLIMRGLLGAAAILCSFYTVSKIKLGEASILFQMAPVFVVIFAHFILKEALPKFFYGLLLLSVVGCLLVIKPSFTNWGSIPALVGIASTAMAAGAYICIRSLGKEHNVYVIVLYFSVTATIAPIPIMLKRFIVPNMTELVILALVGIFATMGQFFMTKAYRVEKAGIVSMTTYTGLFFNIFWGIVIWGEKLDIASIMGGLLILISCLVLSYKTYTYSNEPVQ